MDSVDLQVLKAAYGWWRDGYQVVLGTVARTWGSAPRPQGALVALREDGQIVGSVSGGCIEDDLIEQVRAGALFGTPQHRTYGVNAEEAFRFGLPCGGTVALILETIRTHSHIGPLLEHLNNGKPCQRTLCLDTGTVILQEIGSVSRMHRPPLALTEHTLITYHGPALRLLIIGAGQITHYLADMALACDYAVTVCDPRTEYHAQWRIERAPLVHHMPDDMVIALKPDTSTAIVALTHDPKLDDLALIEALQSEAFYVGAIGSRRTQKQRKERLKEFGVTQPQLARLHGPVGLKNGARTPAEIAIAILAEITAERYGFHVPTPVPKSALSTDH